MREHAYAPRGDLQCLLSGMLLGALFLLAQGCPAEPDQPDPLPPPQVSDRPL